LWHICHAILLSISPIWGKLKFLSTPYGGNKKNLATHFRYGKLCIRFFVSSKYMKPYKYIKNNLIAGAIISSIIALVYAIKKLVEFL